MMKLAMWEERKKWLDEIKETIEERKRDQKTASGLAADQNAAVIVALENLQYMVTDQHPLKLIQTPGKEIKRSITRLN